MDLDIIQILENVIGLKLKKRNRNSYRETGYVLVNKKIVTLNLNNINGFDIDIIVDILTEFEELSQLSLSNNKIDNINSLRKLTKLTKLDLSRNQIIDIDPLSDLRNLVKLNLSHNSIVNISPLKDLKVIEFLTLSTNLISNPFYLGGLISLKELNLDNNKIHNLDFLSQLINLCNLNLARNFIVSIESLGNLEKLEKIDLNYNQISNIKPLSVLIKLKEISLVENLVTDIVPLGYLLNLEIVNLSSNKIESISVIDNLKKLKILWLYNNKIKDIYLVNTLENLEQLSIAKNDIYNIRFMDRLVNLKVLKLNDNFIKNISILERFHKLKHLDVSNNLIESISSLRDLKYLEKLVIRDNQISELPEWITTFGLKIIWHELKYTEKSIILFNNPVTVPPVAIVKQGSEAIKRYFNKIKNEGLDFIYEAKLILVGEGNAGKTSLQKRLLDERSPLPKIETRTRGIEIKDWNFKQEDSQNHVAHIWDFGGQDVYYPVHRFFITENSVFVLLSSTRQTHHNFDYWIPTIYQFGGRSPIIIGQTCHDGNRISWNDLGVYVGNSNFNIIKTQEFPYYELNLPYSNEGLDKIKQTILDQITGLPHYGKGVPKSWILIRDILNKLSKNTPCISFDNFKQICKESSPESFGSLIDIKDCCQFFHDIGVILWYSSNDELKNWVILQPEWAMNAVYKIIDDEEIQKRRGNILSDDFKRLWQDEFYGDKHSILKKMLEIFKIAFPKKHRQENYIIPARLLSIKNENEWQPTESYLRIEYKYDFMPRGMVNQVSAELSRYIINEDEVWNNAVNFYFENDIAECQVIEDFYYRKIIIKAKGRDARGIMVLVMDALNNITEGYKGVKPGIHVPCICAACRISMLPTTFLYSKLIEWLRRRDNATVTCNESGEALLIDELLYNVGLPNPENKTPKKFMNKTITLFLASSSELAVDREQFEIFINRENKRLNNDGIFIKLELWEDFIDAMSHTRLQDEYNKIVKECDIFVTLFFSKVGKYTEEEFETAFGSFKGNGKPLIYTYFKNEKINMSDINEKDILSKIRFDEKLKSLGHFPSQYNNIEDLKFKFKSQLDKILPNL